MDSETDAPPTQTNFCFFQLPYHLQIEIISYLALKDTRSFAVTSKESNLLAQDQQMWKKKLWHLAKAVNLSLEYRRIGVINAAEILTQDPLLVDMKRMYEILGPAMDRTVTCEVDMENLLSKYDPPSIMTFTSIGLQEILHYFQMFFLKPRPRLFHDPFSKGEGAPTFLLFGPPESSLSRKLGLSFIASKDAMFETVGLVRGRPGGLGGGVTVKMGSRLMNFLPVRRARRLRLLLDKPTGTEFHPDVAEVASHVDGLIYYMDAKCDCEARQKANFNKKTSSSFKSTGQSFHSPNYLSKNCIPSSSTSSEDQISSYNPGFRPLFKGSNPTISHTGYLPQNSWQIDSASRCDHKLIHNLDNEFHELEAMMKALPEGVCSPILVLLIRQGRCPVAEGGASESPNSEEKDEAVGAEGGAAESPYSEDEGATSDGGVLLHKPSDLYHRLIGLKNPWMATNVEVPSLDGVRQGVHWIYERTLLLKKGR